MSKRALGAVLALIAAALLAWFLWPRGGGEARGTGASARDAGAAVALPAAPARGGIDGVVRDAQGAAIAGAVVRAVGPGADDAPTATTRADGAFALEVAPGRWTVTAGAPGHSPASVDAEVAAGARARVELRLAGGGAKVHGIVLDATGGPVGGAIVVLSAEHGVLEADARHGVAAISDPDGTFEVGAAAGRWRVATRHPEYVPDERAIDVGPAGAELEIRLVPGGVVEGTVRDRASNAPVAGARVHYAREIVATGPMAGPGGAAAEQRERGEVVAGPDGTFRVAGLGAGRIVLRAETDDDRASDEPTEVQIGIAETATDVDVFVAPALSIAGRVQFEDGTPAPGAQVTVGARGEMSRVTADAQGGFRAGGLRAGRYMVTAEAEGALPEQPITVELANAPVRDVVVTVKRGAYITGRVDPAEIAEVSVIRPDAEPDLAGPGGPMMMSFAIGGPSVRTEADGTFRIGPFEPGPVKLGARAADGRRGETDVVVDAKGTSGVVITLEARGRIAGRVRTKAGAPVPGALVSLRRASGGGRRTTIVNGVDVGADRAPCDPQGRFSISGLDAGTWELTVLDERGAAVAFDRPGDKDDKDAPEKVQLAANQTRDDVELVVEALDGVIRGTVVGPDGKPVPDAWVAVTHEGGFLGLRGPPGAPGGRVPGGRAPGAGPGPVLGGESVGGGGGGEPGAGPDGPVGPDGPDGPVDQMVIAIVDDGGTRAGEIPPVLTGPDGRFEVRNLRRGDYHVRAEGLRGSARGGVDHVATGSDVTIKLRQLSRLRGTVTMGGAPAVDFAVIAHGPTEKRRDVHDAAGRFSMSGLDPGDYEIEARAGGGTGRATVTIQPGQESTIAIDIPAPGTVAGKVVDAQGAPVAGRLVIAVPRQPAGQLSIELDGAPPTTTPDGSFRVVTEAGPRTLIVMGPRGPLVRQDIDVVAGKVLELGTITAQPLRQP